MDSMQTLIKKTLAKRGLLKHAEASLVVYRAQAWLHRELEEFKDEIVVESFKDGVLSVHCTHSVALQECAMRQPELLTFLRDKLGCSSEVSMRCVRA